MHSPKTECVKKGNKIQVMLVLQQFTLEAGNAVGPGIKNRFY